MHQVPGARHGCVVAGRPIGNRLPANSAEEAGGVGLVAAAAVEAQLQHHAREDAGRGERPAGRAELLAKWQHTDRLQNPAKLRRFWIRGGIRAG